MSVFTGELPGVHRATRAAFDGGLDVPFFEVDSRPFDPVHPERMLPRRLRGAGYHTVGISCNPWVSSRTGFGVGFDAMYATWHAEHRHVPDPALPPSPLELVLAHEHLEHPVGKALQAFNHHLRAHDVTEDFFVFFNFIDAHYPYISARDVGLEYGGNLDFYESMADPERRKRELDIIAGAETIDFDQLEPFYDSCIHYVDRAVGRLVAWLKQHDLYDQTMIVVTSDHGEHLGEDGKISHQLSVDEELLRVPLIIKYPGSENGGATVDNPFVSGADPYQTVLGAAGVVGEEAGYSRDLARMDEWDRPYSVAEYYYSDSHLARFRSRNPEFDVEPHRTVYRVMYAANRKFVYRGVEQVSAEPLDGSVTLPADPDLQRRMSLWLSDYVQGLDASALPSAQNPLPKDNTEHLEFVEALRTPGVRALGTGGLGWHFRAKCLDSLLRQLVSKTSPLVEGATMQHHVSTARRVRNSSVLIGLTGAVCGAFSATAAAQEPITWLPLNSPEQRAVIVDNSTVANTWWTRPLVPHAAGFNGISYLSHGSLERSLLVPDLAAMNFEHIFSGDSSSYGWPRVAPRKNPMTLAAPILGQRLALTQANAGNWPLQTKITYERRKPDAIDFEIQCTPLQDVWSKHGYIGIFFASYIDQPADRAIYFIGRSRPGQGDPTPRWIRHLPPSYGVDMNHRPAGSNWDPPIDPGFHIGLIEGFSSLEYVHPFYFGVTQGKVMIFMFAPPESGELRFAQAPNGGGPGNPAWDFIYMERQYVIGQAFTVVGRMVCKDFVDFEDVIQSYEAWTGRKIPRP